MKILKLIALLIVGGIAGRISAKKAIEEKKQK